MRCLSKQNLSLFWILLSTVVGGSHPVAAANDGAAAGGGPQQPVPAPGNYDAQNPQAAAAPSMMLLMAAGGFGDNGHMYTSGSSGSNNNNNRGGNNDKDNYRRSNRGNAGDSQSKDNTFDGGGGGEDEDVVDPTGDDNDHHNDDDDDEEHREFNQFAIGTLNHHHRSGLFGHHGLHDDDLLRTTTKRLSENSNPGGSSSERGGRWARKEEKEEEGVDPRRPSAATTMPMNQDEIDDEMIFYDIVDSKHFISRLGGANRDRLLPPLLHQHQRSTATALLSQASKATKGGGASSGNNNPDASCHLDDPHCSEMEAIQSLHKKLDDDANGNIDISESTDFLRQELKYDSGYENRHRVFHFNDDMHISVRELWEAWRRSEVHNWTVEQTTEWLAQSVQLPQYVELFKHHKVTGAYLPRLAVDNMQYLTSVLGIKDHIHKQKIALKAMDVVLFGPPRETGTRWKDYILVTLLLSVIVGCWYGYQQNKNSKTHLRRMAKDMEGLQKAEQALQEMQKELERARLEQENVATEKMDLERRLKETPSLSSSSSDLEVQQLKQEIEMLRRELSRAEIELVDHCWSPPQGLQTWLQLTYELESKSHQAKRRTAEKQLLAAREACEKLKRKRTSLVGAFVSTHGKSIDDVDRSIVEARNSLGEVTHELQERMHRWKQIEQILGFNVVNNNGIAHLESILYSRNGTTAGKMTRANRMSSSQDELDDESVTGRQPDSLDRSFLEDSSASEENDNRGGGGSAKFIVGEGSLTPTSTAPSSALSQQSLQMHNSLPGKGPPISLSMAQFRLRSADSLSSLSSSVFDDNRSIPSSDRVPLPPRGKKGTVTPPIQAASGMPPPPPYQSMTGRTPMPPPRKSAPTVVGVVSSSAATTPVDECTNYSGTVSSSSSGNKLVHQLSTTSTSTSSNESAAVSTKAAGGCPVVQASCETPPSTDSSIVDDEGKKRKRKLHFPFGRRSKNKSSSSGTTKLG